jgi:L-fucose isomerase
MSETKKAVGLITLSLPRERTDLAEAFGRNATAALESAGFETYGDEKPVFDTDGCLNTARTLKERGADCILILLGTWVFAPTVVDTIRAVDIPFGVWAEDNPASFSLTAGGVVHGSLDEHGLKHRFFYGSPKSEKLVGEVSAFVNAAACARALSEQRLCVVGGRVMGMYTTMADVIQVKNTFGLEIEHIDTVRVYMEAERLPPDRVSTIKESLSANFGQINTEGRVLDRSIRLYLALKDILESDGYTIAAVKCQEEMINNYASFCLATSLLNDDGFTISCEADINAAITMTSLRSISGGIALFGDVNHLDHEENTLRIVNCGSMPTLMAESRKDVDIENQYEYMGKAGGATTVFSVRESPVTIARLFRIKGEYGMVASEGDTLRLPKERFKEAREFWPHVLVRLGCDSYGLVPHIRSNHMHLCFGHHLDSLREFCGLKGIRFIYPDAMPS